MSFVINWSIDEVDRDILVHFPLYRTYTLLSSLLLTTSLIDDPKGHTINEPIIL